MNVVRDHLQQVVDGFGSVVHGQEELLLLPDHGGGVQRPLHVRYARRQIARQAVANVQVVLHRLADQPVKHAGAPQAVDILRCSHDRIDPEPPVLGLPRPAAECTSQGARAHHRVECGDRVHIAAAVHRQRRRQKGSHLPRIQHVVVIGLPRDRADHRPVRLLSGPEPFVQRDPSRQFFRREQLVDTSDSGRHSSFQPIQGTTRPSRHRSEPPARSKEWTQRRPHQRTLRPSRKRDSPDRPSGTGGPEL